MKYLVACNINPPSSPLAPLLKLTDLSLSNNSCSVPSLQPESVLVISLRGTRGQNAEHSADGGIEWFVPEHGQSFQTWHLSKNNLLIGFEKYDTSIALCFQFRVIPKLAFSQKVNVIDWFSRELSHRPKMTFEELVMRLLFTALISSNYAHPRVSFRAIHSK